MYLHLGQDRVVYSDEIVGIFDLDTTTVSKISRDYLTEAEKNGEVITVSSDLPKSFVLCESANEKQKVFISPISTSTLIKRIGYNK